MSSLGFAERSECLLFDAQMIAGCDASLNTPATGIAGGSDESVGFRFRRGLWKRTELTGPFDFFFASGALYTVGVMRIQYGTYSYSLVVRDPVVGRRDEGRGASGNRLIKLVSSRS